MITVVEVQRFLFQEVKQQKFIVKRSHPIVTRSCRRQTAKQVEKLQTKTDLLAAIQAKAKAAVEREEYLATQYPEVR